MEHTFGPYLSENEYPGSNPGPAIMPQDQYDQLLAVSLSVHHGDQLQYGSHPPSISDQTQANPVGLGELGEESKVVLNGYALIVLSDQGRMIGQMTHTQTESARASSFFGTDVARSKGKKKLKKSAKDKNPTTLQFYENRQIHAVLKEGRAVFFRRAVCDGLFFYHKKSKHLDMFKNLVDGVLFQVSVEKNYGSAFILFIL